MASSENEPVGRTCQAPAAASDADVHVPGGGVAVRSSRGFVDRAEARQIGTHLADHPVEAFDIPPTGLPGRGVQGHRLRREGRPLASGAAAGVLGSPGRRRRAMQGRWARHRPCRRRGRLDQKPVGRGRGRRTIDSHGVSPVGMSFFCSALSSGLACGRRLYEEHTILGHPGPAAADGAPAGKNILGRQVLRNRPVFLEYAGLAKPGGMVKAGRREPPTRQRGRRIGSYICTQEMVR